MGNVRALKATDQELRGIIEEENSHGWLRSTTDGRGSFPRIRAVFSRSAGCAEPGKTANLFKRDFSNGFEKFNVQHRSRDLRCSKFPGRPEGLWVGAFARRWAQGSDPRSCERGHLVACPTFAGIEIELHRRH